MLGPEISTTRAYATRTRVSTQPAQGSYAEASATPMEGGNHEHPVAPVPPRCLRQVLSHDYLVMDRRSTATLICDGAARSCFHTQASLSRSVIGSASSPGGGSKQIPANSARRPVRRFGAVEARRSSVLMHYGYSSLPMAHPANVSRRFTSLKGGPVSSGLVCPIS